MAEFSEKALTAFLVENQNRFYRLAYSYLKNQDDALDAVQSGVCRALERQDSLRQAGAMTTWFYRILVHVCLDMLRQESRVVSLPDEELDVGTWEDPLPADDSLARRVDALPPDIATVIRLRFYEDMPLKDISTITNSNLSTVKTRLYSGLKKLRVSMEGEV